MLQTLEGPGTQHLSMLGEDSQEKIVSLLKSPITGSLLVLLGDAEVTFSAASFIANSLVKEEHHELDIKVAAPEKDRWSIVEVDSFIINATSYMPLSRTVVIVTLADQMDTRAAEHILKTIEEPPGNALFIFCAASESLLPTILSRSFGVLHLRSAPLKDIVATLLEKGLSSTDAQQLAFVAAKHPSLITSLMELPLEKREEMALVIKKFFATSPSVSSPTKTAVELVETATSLSNMVFYKNKKAPKATSPQVKSYVRVLVMALLHSWRQEVILLLQGDLNAAQYEKITLSLEYISKAELELKSYSQPTYVLAATLSRLFDV